MLGKYKADETQLRNFGLQGLQAALLPFSIFLVPMIALYIASDFSTPLLLMILFPIIIGSIAILVGSDKFTKIIITLEDDRIIRTGIDTLEAQIAYSDIGSIFVKANGIVVVKKGFVAHWSLLSSRTAYRCRRDILFIPSVIQDYEKIKKFVLHKKDLQKVAITKTT